MSGVSHLVSAKSSPQLFLLIAWLSIAVELVMVAAIPWHGDGVFATDLVAILIAVVLLPAMMVNIVLWIWLIKEYRYRLLLLVPLLCLPLVNFIVPIGFLAMLTVRYLKIAHRSQARGES